MSSGCRPVVFSDGYSLDHSRGARARTPGRAAARDRSGAAHAVRHARPSVQPVSVDYEGDIAQRAVSTLVGALSSSNSAVRSIHRFIQGRNAPSQSDLDERIATGFVDQGSPGNAQDANDAKAGHAKAQLPVRIAPLSLWSARRVATPTEMEMYGSFVHVTDRARCPRLHGCSAVPPHVPHQVPPHQPPHPTASSALARLACDDRPTYRQFVSRFARISLRVGSGYGRDWPLAAPRQRAERRLVAAKSPPSSSSSCVSAHTCPLGK
jgi:hypothetical protein